MNSNNLIQLSPEQLFNIREDVDKELCFRSLQHFIISMWRYVETEKFVPGKHIDLICSHLQAVREGDIKRLLINIPPRCMKSLTVSVFFPAWCWLHEPTLKFLFASYSEALSIRDSVRCRRLIQSPKYQLLLRHRKLDWILTTDQNTKTRFDNSKGGHRIATSVGGMLTGEGGDIICLPEESLVLTSAGNIPIGRIVKDKLPVKIITLDDGGEFHQRDVLSYQENPGADIYEIQFSSGTTLRCTGEHPVWAENRGCYVPAKELTEGDVCLEVAND